MNSISFLSIVGLISFGFIVAVKCNGDEYFIGKYKEKDETLFFASYGLKRDPCQIVLGYKCSNNQTHFVLNFKTNKKSCISAIKLTSYPKINQNSDLTRNLYCQTGGIGTDNCKLVFKKKRKQIAANIEIYGIPAKKCSFKDRYIGTDPLHVDSYGLPYQFDKENGWNLERNNILKDTRFSTEVFYHKNGLFNTQITYLAEEDSFSEAREITAKDIKKKFSIILPNEEYKRISFLDVYWFQETMRSKPKYPYIHYNGECSNENKTCEIIFDTDELMTYALVKVFTNPESDGSRLKEKDLGRG
ncbi:lufaxin [Lutzomyia longipalpis]|uniref:lufaxin n=1 Tax=Lutzomyia longipalpis TaxID=7200 RepID=UPI00248466FD|nr:lufaxin [Lutzomyia longipalpis]